MPAETEKLLDVQHCNGCEDDFYNDHNPMGVKACWNRRGAVVVLRFATGTWTDPTSRGAFRERMVPRCYRAKDLHFSDELPDFVRSEDVVQLDGKLPLRAHREPVEPPPTSSEGAPGPDLVGVDVEF